MICEFILLFIIGMSIHPGPLFWVIYWIWVLYKSMQAFLDKAPEMEEPQ